jgi:hypothetical protein
LFISEQQRSTAHTMGEWSFKLIMLLTRWSATG